jgi:hypothetical protein
MAITRTSRTAGNSAIATASVANASALIIPPDSLAATYLVGPSAAVALMGRRLPACVPARSVVLIMEVTRGHLPLAAEQAQARGSVAAGVSMVAVVIDENNTSNTVKSIKGD